MTASVRDTTSSNSAVVPEFGTSSVAVYGRFMYKQKPTRLRRSTFDEEKLLHAERRGEQTNHSSVSPLSVPQVINLADGGFCVSLLIYKTNDGLVLLIEDRNRSGCYDTTTKLTVTDK